MYGAEGNDRNAPIPLPLPPPNVFLLGLRPFYLGNVLEQLTVFFKREFFPNGGVVQEPLLVS